MERVEREQRAAADLLRVCALLQAGAIPEELFVAGATHLGPALESLVADSVQFDQAIAALRRLSLVQRQAEIHTLSLHRLVQAVVRERMSEQEQAAWLRRVIAALGAVFPEVSYEVWGQCERLLSHTLTIAAAIPDQAGDQVLAEVVQKAADYLYERARYKQAEPLFQRVLCLREQTLGSEHPDLASPLNGLAILSWEQGKYEQAEPLYQRALRIWERALGPEHPETTYALNGLADLYAQQGKDEQAEPLYQCALRIRELTVGSEHPLVASTLKVW